MKIYKVVKRVNGKLHSAVVYNNREFCLIYEVGKKTSAPDGYPDAWPFAFKTHEQADRFLMIENHEMDMEVYLAEAGQVITIYDCAIDLKDMGPFWQNPGDPELIMQAPTGAVLCDWITLLEKVG